MRTAATPLSATSTVSGTNSHTSQVLLVPIVLLLAIAVGYLLGGRLARSGELHLRRRRLVAARGSRSGGRRRRGRCRLGLGPGLSRRCS